MILPPLLFPLTFYVGFFVWPPGRPSSLLLPVSGSARVVLLRIISFVRCAERELLDSVNGPLRSLVRDTPSGLLMDDPD
jgi:hypothetical protein